MKNSILSLALESLETPVSTALPATVTTEAKPQSTQAQADGTQQTDPIIVEQMEKLNKDKLVMNAPLSTIFTRALNIALAKKDPATGKYEGQRSAAVEVGDAVAVESQAQDLQFFAANRNIIQDALMEARPGDPTEPKVPEIPEALESSGSGTRLVTHATKEEIINFVNLDETQHEHKVAFVTKVDARTDGVMKNHWDQQDMIWLNDNAGQGYVVESVEIVVHTRKIDA